MSEAIDAHQQHKLGVGYVLNGSGEVGIDLDDCRNPETGKLSGWAEDIIDRLKTYAEVSPSQTGVKLLIRGKLPEHFGSVFRRPDGDGEVEVYAKGRYFTLTGNKLPGAPDDIRENQSGLNAVAALLKSWKNTPAGNLGQYCIDVTPSASQLSDDRETALAAIAVLSADDYQQWLSVGMALHSVDSSAAMLAEYDRWSQTSEKYQPGDAEKKWRSFSSSSSSGITIGTLCHLADQTGRQWRPAKTSQAFGTSDTSPEQEKPKSTAPEEWPDPEYLPEGLAAVQPFDYSLLPDAFQARVKDIATRMSCPPDFSAVALIVAAASVIGRKVTIRPKKYDDWTVVPNLWGCVVGRPGLMKTSAVQQGLHPLRTLAHEAGKEHEQRLKDAEAARELALLKAKKLRKEAQAALDDGECSDEAVKKLLMESKDAENSQAEIPLKRYIVMDSTYEAVSDMLIESPNGFLQFRDELAGWWASLSRDGQENARSFYLECWNGDGDYYIDRVMRGRMYVPSNTVSVLGATQPGKLRSYLQGALRGDSSDDGMIQRHQLLVWPDTTTEWRKVDNWPNSEAKNTVMDIFRRLDKLDPHGIEATTDDGDFPYLRFTAEAQAVFDEWFAKLEHQLRSDSDPPYLESHFSKYRSLIPSLALVFHLVDIGHGAVGLDAINRAIQWGEYLASHARRAYGGAHDAAMDGAKQILQHVAEGELTDAITVRSIYRNHWTGLSTKEQAEAAIDVLADFGWLRTEKVKQDCRPSIVCRLHPKISDFLQRRSAKSAKSHPEIPFGTFGTDREQEKEKFSTVQQAGRDFTEAEMQAASQAFT